MGSSRSQEEPRWGGSQVGYCKSEFNNRGRVGTLHPQPRKWQLRAQQVLGQGWRAAWSPDRPCPAGEGGRPSRPNLPATSAGVSTEVGQSAPARRAEAPISPPRLQPGPPRPPAGQTQGATREGTGKVRQQEWERAGLSSTVGISLEMFPSSGDQRGAFLGGG